jgi:hypothetical protein
MIPNLPSGVPPSIWLIMNELSKSKSYEDGRKRLKDMLPELRSQSEAFELRNVTRDAYDRDPMRFDVHLHGALDLFNGQGCSSGPCRVEAAKRIARSVGLIADRVWLTDTLSPKFINFGRVTNAKLDAVMLDAFVLFTLLPMIMAGIFKFRPPFMPTCRSCAGKFDAELEAVIAAVKKTFGRDFKIKHCDNGGYLGYTGKCFDSELIFNNVGYNFEQAPTARAFGEQVITREVQSALYVAREAALTGGSLFTNSRVGLSGLLQREGRLPDRRTLLMLEQERDFNVPWVSELDAAQILQLRQEASTALPAFREKIAKALCVSPSVGLPSSISTTIVQELREQAAEVRGELIAKRGNSSKYWKTTYGLIGLGLSAYGIASDQILPGVGGLLPIINLLINHQTGYETDIVKLTSRPGFVLVKAQDILAHSH